MPTITENRCDQFVALNMEFYFFSVIMKSVCIK